jgi:glycosyltransferase involved in cell wall biosynthesis
LIDWFHSSRVLPRDMELWWVGKMGWLLSPKELEAMTAPPGGRRVRFLGNVSDAELCRLYRTASWSIYPSIYEGFGFPVLDALRHGTPVLTSMNSSLAEFRHPGVFFFDPYDAATVDAAWLEFDRFTGSVIAPAELDRLYSWDRTAAEVLDLAEAARIRRAATPSMRKRTQSSDTTAMRSAAARPEEQGS